MSKKNFERCYHSEAFVDFTRNSPSIASGRGPCVCAHVTPRGELPSGTGRKADAKWIVPLTFEEHTELHTIGEKTFEDRHKLDLAIEAQAHWCRFHDGEPGTIDLAIFDRYRDSSNAA